MDQVAEAVDFVRTEGDLIERMTRDTLRRLADYDKRFLVLLGAANDPDSIRFKHFFDSFEFSSIIKYALGEMDIKRAFKLRAL